jgi:glycolate oxidase FAD binding subunit
MTAPTVPSAVPSTVDEAAILIKGATSPLAPRGSGSRWGSATGTPLDTSGLNQILEHNPGDFTAVLQAGVSLVEAQARFATAGQWLAVDPPAGPNGSGGTIGGLVATADSGPCRQRYGGLRDLVIGITVVLSDGTVASSGGKVIKNVAGYDLGKLFTGSYGSLGLIASVAVRLHPLPRATVTVEGSSADISVLRTAALELNRRPLEALSLDARWGSADGRSASSGVEDGAGGGGLLVRFGGVSAATQAAALAPVLQELGLTDVRVETDDEPLWQAQRDGQRSRDGVVLKVSGQPGDLSRVLGAARDVGASVVSRSGLGLSWIRCDAAAVPGIRSSLKPLACTVTDGAGLVDQVWPSVEPGVAALNRRVKERFDPAGRFPALPLSTVEG